jgi:uncharacterized protein with PIN domain
MNKTNQVSCRFYEELNDFLPHAHRKKEFIHHFKENPSLKDLIESIGVPHTEIELILVNGESVDFSYQVKNNDRISVYPMFEALDMTDHIKLRDKPLREIRFILDCHLGKLAKYLRMAGFDTLFKNDFTDSEIACISKQENRIVLTRDRDLLKRSIIDHGHYVHETLVLKQFKEIINHFDLARQIQPFSRCLDCNGEIIKADKCDIKHLLEPQTLKFYQEFWQCNSCKKIYWQGSHYQSMLKQIRQLSI